MAVAYLNQQFQKQTSEKIPQTIFQIVMSQPNIVLS